MLKNNNKTGVSVIFVEHYHKAATSLPRRFYVMGKAVSALEGTVEELNARPEIRSKCLEV
jgi:ABC-type branched-subunit amino acid transport system ATPase component